MRSIGSKDAVVDLLHEAVLLEEYMELSHNRRLFGLFNLEFEGEELGDMLEDVFAIRMDESSHISWLRRLLDGLGVEVDTMGMKRDIIMSQEMDQPVSLLDAFEQAVQSENQAFHYFTLLSKSLQASNIDGVNTEKLAKGFLGIARAEQKHRDDLHVIYEEYKDLLGRGRVQSTVDDMTQVHSLG